nr:uncharacterized protein LOC115116365 [Oncorhynchus nerka]
MLDKLVLDKYLRALPYEMKKMVRMQNPQSLEELLTVVEIHQNTQDLLRAARAEKGDAARGATNTKRGKELKGARTEPAKAVKREGDSNRRRQRLLDPDQRLCYECGEPGHLAWSCPVREEAMPSAPPNSGTTRMAGYVTSCWAHTETAPPMVLVQIDDIDTSALLDSSSMVTQAHQQWFTREGNEEPGDEEVTVSCVHGDTKRYPTVLVRITTPKGECQIRAGAVPNLPVSILLGRDCPLFQALWRRDLGRRALEVGRKGKKTVACATQP